MSNSSWMSFILWHKRAEAFGRKNRTERVNNQAAFFMRESLLNFGRTSACRFYLPFICKLCQSLSNLIDIPRERRGAKQWKKSMKKRKRRRQLTLTWDRLGGKRSALRFFCRTETLYSDHRCWPSPGDFAFFRALSVVFPVTDFRHPVVSPAQLLLAQYLYTCPLRGRRDMVSS